MSRVRDVSFLTNMDKDQLIRLLATYQQNERNLRAAIDIMIQLIPRHRRKKIPISLFSTKGDEMYKEPRGRAQTSPKE